MADFRLQSIDIHYFKAFKQFQLQLEGRNLLTYGANGSGKSSLYWALYTFLESAGKSTEDIQKYFTRSGNESLVNIHATSAEADVAKIKLILQKAGTDSSYEISNIAHDTKLDPIIAKASLASDFITYRFLFKFADFRNSQSFDIWPLFEQEILPFTHTTGGLDLNAEWLEIKEDLPHARGLLGGAAAKAYQEFEEKISRFNTELALVVDAIAQKTEEFHSEHFHDEETKMELALKVTTNASYVSTDKILVIPMLVFGLKVNSTEIPRPQVFLNEAKLTQVAISVRFAASLVNLHTAPIKLLVLDDLLVSLDLSNRMKVVEILLSETFENYQKIVLTHDLGFFREFRRMIGPKHTNWCFKRLSIDSTQGVIHTDNKSAIEKAEGYISSHDLEEAASCLRKAAEDTAIQYREIQEGKRINNEKFTSLTQHLKKAQNVIRARIQYSTFEKVLENVDHELIPKILAYSNNDIDSDTDLNDETKTLLKVKRKKLTEFLSQEGWRSYHDLLIIDQILRMTDRVLNPASHWGEPALYEGEVRKAHNLIKRLEKCLHK